MHFQLFKTSMQQFGHNGGRCVLLAGTTSAATRRVPSTSSAEPSIATFSRTSLVPPATFCRAGWAPESPPFCSLLPPTLAFFWLDDGPVVRSLRPTHWLFPPVLLSSHSFWPLAISAETSGLTTHGPTIGRTNRACSGDMSRQSDPHWGNQGSSFVQLYFSPHKNSAMVLS